MSLQIIEGPLSSSMPDDAAHVRALAAASAQADGVEPLSEDFLLGLTADTDPSRHHALWREADSHGDAVVGYAQLIPGEPASAELVVHPDARRRGIGRALLDALREVSPRLHVWSHGDLPEARSFATAKGLAPTRELLRMRLELQPGATAHTSTEPTPRPGTSFRAFRQGVDEPALLGVNAAAFARHPEQGRMSLADMELREAEPWFDPEGITFAVQGEEVVAFLWTKIEEGEGEIYVLGVGLAAQGQGLGTTLTHKAIDDFRTRGLSAATLYVDGDNLAAVKTYERAGFVRDAVDIQYS